MEWAIETKDLGMVFRTNWGSKKRALQGLSLQVKKNEIFGFLGHNGAGKTTTIKILVGLCNATEGQAFLLGTSINEVDARKQLGFLPENVSFYEYLTALETIEFYGRLHGLSKKDSEKKTHELLEEVGLAEAKNRRVAEFSKGMKQRLGLAQATIHDPQILILDEPLTGLDPSGRREIREKIRNFRDKGKTIFFSSHVLGDVEMLCDRVAFLRKGDLIAMGDLESLLGDRVLSVQIIGEGFSDDSLEKIKPIADRIENDGQKQVIWVKTEEQAQDICKMLYEDQGILKALIPQRESLEDFYFRRAKESKVENMDDCA